LVKEVRNVKFKKKTIIIMMVATIGLSLLLGLASAAGAITLTPTAQAPSASVTVDGTGFGATKTVAIGFGAEVADSQTEMPFSGTGVGPYSGYVSDWPVKPGSFVLTADTTASGGLVSTYTDNGDGTLSGSFEGAIGTINYTTGQWSRTSTADLTGMEQHYSAEYIRYEYNVTPAAGVNTIASGTFTASITVPSVANGNYAVTAIDTEGNIATATLGVDSAIPEGLTIGVMVLLSTVAVIAGSRYFRKQPRIKSHNQVKP
jgi:hypothetical protein